MRLTKEQKMPTATPIKAEPKNININFPIAANTNFAEKAWSKNVISVLKLISNTSRSYL